MKVPHLKFFDGSTVYETSMLAKIKCSLCNNIKQYNNYSIDRHLSSILNNRYLSHVITSSTALLDALIDSHFNIYLNTYYTLLPLTIKLTVFYRTTARGIRF